MNKILIPYDLWEVGIEISHMHCMTQAEKNTIKDKAKNEGDQLTPTIVHISLCMCLCILISSYVVLQKFWVY